MSSTVTYGLSTRKVSKHLGVTERQLYHWVTKGYIPGLDPPGSGGFLRWMPEHIEHARKIRTAIDQLLKLTGPEMGQSWGQSVKWAREDGPT